jgi:O-antigen/teichoic acid export membrane protein
LKAFISRVQSIFGIDRDIAWILINKFFAAIKAPIIVFFIIRYLTPVEQGTWYTFTSLGALSMFAELGFAGIMTQFISHEFAHVEEINGRLVGDRKRLDRIIGLIRFSVRLYFIVIPIAIFILTVIGFFYFGKKFDNIYCAWILFSIVGGLSLFSSLLQAIYQGLDKIRVTQQNVVLGSLFTTVFMVIFLNFNAGIWALVMGNLLGFVFMIAFLYKAATSIWRQILKHTIENAFDFFSEIFSLQWKYALTFVSGFFIFYLFVPAIYKYESHELAGQFGITMTIVSAITSIGYAWVSSKVPKFNIMVARRQRVELSGQFKNASTRGVVIYAILSAIFLFTLAAMNKYQIYNTRFLSLKYSSLLLVAQLPTLLIGNFGVYLRSHKEEPYYLLSLWSGLISIVAAVIILPSFGFEIFLITIVLANLFLVLPPAFYIYRLFKDRIYPSKYYS